MWRGVAKDSTASTAKFCATPKLLDQIFDLMAIRVVLAPAAVTGLSPDDEEKAVCYRALRDHSLDLDADSGTL